MQAPAAGGALACAWPGGGGAAALDSAFIFDLLRAHSSVDLLFPEADVPASAVGALRAPALSAQPAAAAAAETEAPRAPLPQPAQPVSPRPALTLPGALRCIGVAHPPGCNRCIPAPPEEEEGDYELVGDPGCKNGEKKLRSQLAATREWGDPEAREALAAACGAAAAGGGGALAALLRAKDCSALRKRHLLCLARAWGYRSDLWRKKRDRKADNRAAAAVALLAGAPSLAAAATADALAAHAATVLRALAAEAARVHTGPKARAVALGLALPSSASAAPPGGSGGCTGFAAAACGAAHVNEAYVANTRATARVAAWVATAYRAEHGTLLTWRASLARLGEEEAAQPAWAALCGEPSPAERVFRSLAHTLAVASTHTRVLAARAAQHHGGLDAFEAANVEEMTSSAAASHEFVARCESLLAQLRFSRFELFLHASCALVAEAAGYAAGMADANATRAEWLAEALRRRKAAGEAVSDLEPPCFAEMLAQRNALAAQLGGAAGAAGAAAAAAAEAAAAAAAERGHGAEAAGAARWPVPPPPTGGAAAQLGRGGV